MTKGTVRFENVTKRYGDVTALKPLNINIEQGTLCTLLGPSGCGKTTTLRLIAGLETASSGKILIGGEDVTHLSATYRKVSMVFQSYALFPHMTIADNVAFGLKQRGVPVAERTKRTAEMLERVALGHLADRLPAALSGGQRQRVALARALVIAPPLLMFDEPLSNLDARLRLEMRAEIRTLQRANGTTSVFVTHDQEEAFSISDRVAIMHAGRIMQYDTPENLYQRPANAFVAEFVGYDNLIPMEVTARNGALVTASAKGASVVLSQDDFGAIPDKFILAARPEGLTVSDMGIPAKLGLRTYLGRTYQYVCETPFGEMLGTSPLHDIREPGEAVKLAPVPSQCCILKAE